MSRPKEKLLRWFELTTVRFVLNGHRESFGFEAKVRLNVMRR